MQAGGQAILVAGLRTHVELENAGDHDHGLRPVPVLEHREFHRFGAVHEQAAAKTALILDDPVAAAGRFAFLVHGTSPFESFRSTNLLSGAYEFEREAHAVS